jgi:PAS domain S-box-containing protein
MEQIDKQAGRIVLRGYAIAVAAAAAATAFDVAIAPVVGVRWPFLPFLLAVMVAGRFGGRGPALVATAASTVGVWYAVFEPRNSFNLADPVNMIGLGIFLFVGAGISVMAGQLHGALMRVTRSEQAWKREAELVELSHDAIIVADGQRVISGWNAGAVAMYGWKKSEAMGKVIHQLLRTESGVTTSQMDEVLSREGRWDGELRHTCADGTKVLLDSCQVLVRDSSGAPSGILEINRDITQRKQAEEALQRSEETTRALIESASQGIVGIDSAGRIEIVNAMTERLFGYPREELLGQPLEVLVPERLRVRHQAHRLMFDSNPRSRPMGLGLELMARRKDGSEFAVEISLGTADTPHGRLSVSFITDITERKQAEAALEEASEHRRMALESAGMGAWDYRLQTGEVFWDERCAEMFGVAAGSQVTYNSAIASIHSDDRVAVEDAVSQAIAGARDGAYHDEFRVVRPDGSVHWIASHGRVFFEGKGAQRRATRFIGLNSDITERKRTENTMRRSEALLRAVSENTPDCLFLKDRHNRFLSANPATLRLFGKREDQVLGKGESECMLDPTEGMEIEANDSFTMDRGTTHIVEETIVTPDGSRIFLTSKTPWRNAEGEVIGLIGIARDITERKRAQEEVLRLNAELEQRVRDRTAQLEASNHELEAFSYSVSHDLRAPLRGINGWSLALLEEYGDRLDPQARGYLDRVRSESQRMGHLIDDLLKLSRVTRADMQVETVDLTSLAGSIAARLREAEPARQIEFVIEPGLTASGDPLLMEIALTNLLSNAVKFTGPRALAHIEFGQTRSKGELVFYVRDNGVGFNMAYAHTLFGAFQRLHKPSEFPGTGIGLATVQRVIHRHGGRVDVEAQPNQGATFYFTLGGRNGS